MVPARGIFRGEAHNLESVGQEDRFVFRRKGCVIENVSVHVTESLTVLGTGCEDELSTESEMGREDRKHLPLIIVGQMEEAIPGDECGELLLECELSHVSNDPRALWHSRARSLNHSGGGINPCDGHPFVLEVVRDGKTGAAA